MRDSCCSYGSRRAVPFAGVVREFAKLTGLIGCHVSKSSGHGPTTAPVPMHICRLSTTAPSPIYSAPDAPGSRRSEAAMCTCGSAQPHMSICGVVFHTRSYRDLIRTEFQKLVAFNAASTTTVLAVPLGFVGVTATFFPSVAYHRLFSLILFHWQQCCSDPVSLFFFSYLRLVYRLWIAFSRLLLLYTY
jgi:hypothetical protein